MSILQFDDNNMLRTLDSEMSTKTGKTHFLSFLLAWAPVHKEALAAFSQLLWISVKSISQHIIDVLRTFV